MELSAIVGGVISGDLNPKYLVQLSVCRRRQDVRKWSIQRGLCLGRCEIHLPAVDGAAEHLHPPDEPVNQFIGHNRPRQVHPLLQRASDCPDIQRGTSRSCLCLKLVQLVLCRLHLFP